MEPEAIKRVKYRYLIEEVAKKHNFSLQFVKEKDNWVSICMNKQKC